MRQRWLILFLVLIASFGVLGIGGRSIARNAPPIPAHIQGPAGALVAPGQILEGQKSYLGHGGQHIGSIWGHGAYLAPDWTAKALHRWSELTLEGLRAQGLSEAEAFRWIQKTAMDLRKSMREVAEGVIDHSKNGGKHKPLKK